MSTNFSLSSDTRTRPDIGEVDAEDVTIILTPTDELAPRVSMKYPGDIDYRIFERGKAVVVSGQDSDMKPENDGGSALLQLLPDVIAESKSSTTVTLTEQDQNVPSTETSAIFPRGRPKLVDDNSLFKVPLSPAPKKPISNKYSPETENRLNPPAKPHNGRRPSAPVILRGNRPHLSRQVSCDDAHDIANRSSSFWNNNTDVSPMEKNVTRRLGKLESFRQIVKDSFLGAPKKLWKRRVSTSQLDLGPTPNPVTNYALSVEGEFRSPVNKLSSRDKRSSMIILPSSRNPVTDFESSQREVDRKQKKRHRHSFFLPDFKFLGSSSSDSSRKDTKALSKQSSMTHEADNRLRTLTNNSESLASIDEETGSHRLGSPELKRTQSFDQGTLNRERKSKIAPNISRVPPVAVSQLDLRYDKHISSRRTRNPAAESRHQNRVLSDGGQQLLTGQPSLQSSGHTRSGSDGLILDVTDSNNDIDSSITSSASSSMALTAATEPNDTGMANNHLLTHKAAGVNGYRNGAVMSSSAIISKRSAASGEPVRMYAGSEGSFDSSSTENIMANEMEQAASEQLNCDCTVAKPALELGVCDRADSEQPEKGTVNDVDNVHVVDCDAGSHPHAKEVLSPPQDPNLLLAQQHIRAAPFSKSSPYGNFVSGAKQASSGNITKNKSDPLSMHRNRVTSSVYTSSGGSTRTTNSDVDSAVVISTGSIRGQLSVSSRLSSLSTESLDNAPPVPLTHHLYQDTRLDSFVEDILSYVGDLDNLPRDWGTTRRKLNYPVEIHQSMRSYIDRFIDVEISSLHTLCNNQLCDTALSPDRIDQWSSHNSSMSSLKQGLPERVSQLELEKKMYETMLKRNETLGKQVIKSVEAAGATKSELSRLRSYCEELDKILLLLLKLSGRLARAENAIRALPEDATKSQKENAVKRRDHLSEQHGDARDIKSGIDRRGKQVMSFLNRYFDDQQMSDFKCFVQRKAQFTIDLQLTVDMLSQLQDIESVLDTIS